MGSTYNVLVDLIRIVHAEVLNPTIDDPASRDFLGHTLCAVKKQI